MPPEPILECVPNVSEGRRAGAVEALAAAAGGSPGVHLLDVHSDPDHNRTVLTLAGPPGPLVESALALAAVAVDLVDVRSHEGEHPWLGALDVAPFVPLGRATMQEAVAAAHALAALLWERLRLPCFLYEDAHPHARPLPDVRSAARLGMPPDVGGPVLHPSAGATVVGARGLLVAYNLDLESADVSIARRIAGAVRESGGGLPNVRALAFSLPSRGIVQVSTNLTRPATTTMGDVHDAVASAASVEGVEILGAELVGLTPRAALAGRRPEHLGLRGRVKILEEEVATAFPDAVRIDG